MGAFWRRVLERYRFVAPRDDPSWWREFVSWEPVPEGMEVPRQDGIPLPVWRPEMPARSRKQQRFMGAELRRARSGKKTKTGMSASHLRKFARKPKGGYKKRKKR